MRLLDSNILIYAVLPEYEKLRRWLVTELTETLSVSGITLVEVLGYHALEAEVLADFECWFEELTILSVDSVVLHRAAALRRSQRLKLGDAIIAATALVYGLDLVTRNEADFKSIPDLSIINPIDNPA